MVTIKEISKACGYSVSTVSKALNDALDISAETREKVRRTAERMGYTSNSAARILKTGRSYNFGVLFEDASNKGLTHHFFSHILNGFKHRAEELGYDILFISNGLSGKELSYVDHARYRSCDGVIIAAVDYNQQAVTNLIDSGIPVVTLDQVFDACGSVVSDNVRGVEDLVKYVYQLGHRKIAFIHGQDIPVTQKRVAGFKRCCRELGIPLNSEYIIESEYSNPELASKFTKQLLNMPDPPTCIFYPDDISYIGGMNQIEEMGMSIPEDVSAVGYDGTDISQMFRPRLTTLKQDAETMGAKAAEELAKCVEEGSAYVPGRIIIPGSLLKGDTVRDLRK